MDRKLLNTSPVEGKTYSLFGTSDSTDNYYRTIKIFADTALASNPDISKVIGIIRKFSPKKRFLKNAIAQNRSELEIYPLLNLINSELKQFTVKTEVHLKGMPLIQKIKERSLATTREQYHLYMLEIELTNRLNREIFIKADKKIALLPHCLQDFSVSCKSEKTDFDYQCKHCSAKCYQNHISMLLKKNGIEPYIWMGGSFKRIAKSTLKSGKSFAVLGIACIPELTAGLRRCAKYGIPAVGIPLNANRCRRWFGEFLPNSVNLDEVEKMISLTKIEME
ncbi:MAG: DUF116 domain-containing protein [Bacteroidota bacterium]